MKQTKVGVGLSLALLGEVLFHVHVSFVTRPRAARLALAAIEGGGSGTWWRRYDEGVKRLRGPR